MNYYRGTEKPYIYTHFPEAHAAEAEEYLSELSKMKILFGRPESPGITKKEAERVRLSHAVLLFADPEFLRNEDFRKIVDTAIESGRNILVIYLDGAAPCDSWSHMQLDPAQSLWRDSFAEKKQFLKKLMEAEIFRNVRVSPEQLKKKGRRNSLIRLLLAGAIAVLSVLVLWPKAVAPGIQKAREAAEEQEAAAKTRHEGTFFASELSGITRLAVYGTHTIGPDVEHAYVEHDRDHGSYVLVERHRDGKEKRTAIAPARGKIRELSGIEELSGLRELTLSMQPLTDVSPAFSLEDLEYLRLEYCPVTDLSGIEQCKSLHGLEIVGSRITEMPYLGEREEFVLRIRDPLIPVTDLSFLESIRSFEALSMDRADPCKLSAALSGKNVRELGLNESGIERVSELKGIEGTRRLELCSCEKLFSLRGIEQWNDLEYVHLAWCPALLDLRPLLLLPNLSILEVGEDLYVRAKIELKDAPFAIVREGEAP